MVMLVVKVSASTGPYLATSGVAPCVSAVPQTLVGSNPFCEMTVVVVVVVVTLGLYRSPPRCLTSSSGPVRFMLTWISMEADSDSVKRS